MELAFDNSILEDNKDEKLKLIRVANDAAFFAKKNCGLAHNELVEMSKTNTGGSRKRKHHKRRTHRKRTHRKRRTQRK
jgi:hypothetical protein